MQQGLKVQNKFSQGRRVRFSYSFHFLGFRNKNQLSYTNFDTLLIKSTW
jgi:hypothetical protein